MSLVSHPKMCRTCHTVPSYGGYDYCSKACARNDKRPRRGGCFGGGGFEDDYSEPPITVINLKNGAGGSTRQRANSAEYPSLSSSMGYSDHVPRTTTSFDGHPRKTPRNKLCQYCGEYPKAGSYQFCSKSCAAKFASTAPQQRAGSPYSPSRVLSPPAAQFRTESPQGMSPYDEPPTPRRVGRSLPIYESFARSPPAGQRSLPSIPSNLSQCTRPGCKNWEEAPGARFCGDKCRQKIVKSGLEAACLFCRKLPKAPKRQFCSKNCKDKAAKAAPLLLEVPHSDPKFNDIARQFSTTWKTGPPPGIKHIYKVVNSQKMEADYEAYRDKVEAAGKFVDTGKAPGNENRRWHGTVRQCRIGDNPKNLKPCSSSSCSMCCIIKKSYDSGRSTAGWFGKGIYSSATSSGSNDYTGGPPHGSRYRAMFLNRVVVGKAHILTDLDQGLKGPPQGCHSVIANVNPAVGLVYDELVVYRNDAIRPSWLVVYEDTMM